MAVFIGADNGTVSGAGGLRLGGDSSGILQLTSGANTAAVTIDSSQNVGVGVTPSVWYSYSKVIQSGQSGALETRSNANLTALSTNQYINASGNYTYLTTDYATRYYQNNGQHIWQNAPSGTAGTTATLTQAMTLDNSGNLGLGVTPSAWGTLKALQIGNGAAIASAYNSTYIYANAYYNGTNSIYLSSNKSASYSLDGVNGTHSWSIAGSGTVGGTISYTQAMTLDNSGIAYIGATSGLGSRLNLIKDTNSTVENLLWLRNSGTGYKGARITFGEYTTVNGYITNQYISSGPNWCTDIGSTNLIRFFIGSDPGTEAARIDSSGNLNFKTSNAGIVFNNSSALANSTLNDYETGTWTPNQGSGLTVVGSFSSGGVYTKIGRMVYLQGYVSGSTSIAVSSAGLISSNTPFTSTGSGIVGLGGATNGGGTVSSVTNCGPNSTNVSSGSAISTTNTIYFSLIYQATF